MTLTPIEYFKGKKNTHPTVRCVCHCGNERIVRTSRLRRGKITCCSICAHKRGSIKGGLTRKKYSDKEVILRERLSQYKTNSKKKSREFLLDDDDALTILNAPCAYCGDAPSLGIDRVDNLIGYTKHNSQPCCSKCNYAKRDMTHSDFISFIRRVFNYTNLLP